MQPIACLFGICLPLECPLDCVRYRVCGRYESWNQDRLKHHSDDSQEVADIGIENIEKQQVVFHLGWHRMYSSLFDLITVFVVTWTCHRVRILQCVKYSAVRFKAQGHLFFWPSVAFDSFVLFLPLFWKCCEILIVISTNFKCGHTNPMNTFRANAISATRVQDLIYWLQLLLLVLASSG